MVLFVEMSANHVKTITLMYMYDMTCQQQRHKKDGDNMVIRRIWIFWEELKAKRNVCHNLRVTHMSTCIFSPL